MPPLKTGQFSCFNSSGNPIFCSGTKHDGELQNGTNYSFTSNNDGTVIDNHTGLVWAACTNGHTYPGCTGTPVSENHANAILNCSNSTLAGRTWRLPNYYEYATLSRTGLSTAIDSTYFPNPPNNEQWTNSNRYGSSSDAHTIDFTYNFHQHLVKTSPINFRCVSGEEWTPVDSFEDLGNGSIKDNRTGLIWQKCSLGLTPPNCTGSFSNPDWDTALGDCDNLNTTNFAGRTDWRLPNAHELLSIVRIHYAEQTNPTYFPNIDSGFAYWTSTTNISINTQAYAVQFSSGSSTLSSNNKFAGRRVRCVAGP